MRNGKIKLNKCVKSIKSLSIKDADKQALLFPIDQKIIFLN